MNSSTLNASTTRNLRKAKAKKRTRSKGRSATAGNGGYHPTVAAAGTLTRTKALLLAALRVWELKHRIHE
jgi:hypothetical protein